ncbi:MAG: aminoacyl-tRNA hydrolase [Victivallales bacterium]|nr:aminoacyl-tRNA hydrolase [Victivallales bacterium]
MANGILQIGDRLSIPENEIQYEYCRSSGPGGQNVNKTDSAVHLRFDILHSPSLPEDVRVKLLALCGNMVNDDGVLDLFSQKFRHQLRNKFDVREKLIVLLMRAAKPERKRIKTKPTKASVERRLEEKAQHSQRKSERKDNKRIDY